MRRPRGIRGWLVTGVAVLVIGLAAGMALIAWPFLTYPRAQLDFRIPEARAPEAIAQAEAGMAEVDITPAIGLPKFGYSTWAENGDGFRTRLKARAFYLHGPGQTPMALVQLDLGAGSLALHYAVAQRIAGATDVPPNALTLLVTHTHSGPGQYLGSDFYNAFGSNRPGFDPKLFRFLSERIAQAVIQAYQDRRPARFAVGQSRVWGLTRNRSLGAWARDHNLDPDTLDGDAARRAVNPRMTMLRIDLRADDDRFYPAGALTFFSIHGTAIPAFRKPYHADVWHWMSEDLVDHVGGGPWPFVHATAEATHADNDPAWRRGHRGDREARRIGHGLGAAAIQLFDRLGDQLSPRLTVQAASRQLDLYDLPDDQRFGLCRRPVVGAAVAGAANGDEVFPISYLPYFQEGWPRSVFTDGCQGVKQWMLSKLQLLLPRERFPHDALFQVLRINDLVIVPLPWEITLESGNAIRGAVTETLPSSEDWKVVISSLANGYFGYATTPAEYGAQYYEGGHTLYGPHTLDFLVHQSRRLSRDLMRDGEVDDHPREMHFSLLRHQYWPTLAHPNRTWPRRWLQQARFVPGEGEKSAYWRWRFRGEPPAGLALDKPLMRIESARDGALRADDQHGDLRIRLVSQDDGAGVYEVRWYHPPVTPRGALQLEIQAGDHAPSLTSAPFP